MTHGLTTGGKTAPAPSLPRVGMRRRRGAPAWPRGIVLFGFVAGLCILCGAVADVPLARWALQATPAAHAAAAVGSALGNSNYMLAVSGLLALTSVALGRRAGLRRGISALGERAAFVFATVATSGLLAQALKHLVGRARPRLVETLGAFHLDPFSLKASLASFPSGHTASAFGLATALALMERRFAPVLLVAAGLVGVARVTLGAHFLSDVVAGAALGSAVTLGLAPVFARRRIAFEPVADGGVRLKDDGALWPALASLARGTDGPA